MRTFFLEWRGKKSPAELVWVDTGRLHIYPSKGKISVACTFPLKHLTPRFVVISGFLHEGNELVWVSQILSSILSSEILHDVSAAVDVTEDIGLKFTMWTERWNSLLIPSISGGE